jgi:hypothetical protein
MPVLVPTLIKLFKTQDPQIGNSPLHPKCSSIWHTGRTDPASVYFFANVPRLLGNSGAKGLTTDGCRPGIRISETDPTPRHRIRQSNGSASQRKKWQLPSAMPLVTLLTVRAGVGRRTRASDALGVARTSGIGDRNHFASRLLQRKRRNGGTVVAQSFSSQVGKNLPSSAAVSRRRPVAGVMSLLGEGFASRIRCVDEW